MKKLRLTPLFVLFLLFCGEAKAQEVSYKIIIDEPDIKNLTIGLNIIDFNAYSANTSLNYNIYGNAQLGKLLQADADFKRAYTDLTAGLFSPTDIGKSHEIRLGGRFNLVNTLHKGRKKVVLSSFTSGRTTTTTSIQVPATSRRILSVRGGIQNYRNICDLSSMPSNDDNTMYYKSLAGNKALLRDSTSYEPLHYTVLTSGLYGGISYQTMANVIINADGYGRKSTSFRNDFYFDVLLTPLVNYQIVANANQAGYSGVDLNNEYNSKKYFGWRLGWQYFLGRKVGMTVKSEFGQQPGNYQGSWYLSFGMGLGIGANVPGLTKFGNKKPE